MTLNYHFSEIGQKILFSVSATQLPEFSRNQAVLGQCSTSTGRNPAEILEVTKTFLCGFLAELLVISRIKLLFQFIPKIAAGCLPLYTVLVPM